MHALNCSFVLLHTLNCSFVLLHTLNCSFVLLHTLNCSFVLLMILANKQSQEMVFKKGFITHYRYYISVMIIINI